MNSSYLNLLLKTTVQNLDGLKNIAKECLPEYLKNAPWKAMQNRGKDIVDDEERLNAYLVAYSDMHQKKLDILFKELPISVLKNSFEIVDWGCGQGIGTLAFFEYMNSKHLSLDNLNKIYLIEPSKDALIRAYHHALLHTNKEKLYCIKCSFDELNILDIDKCETPIIHIFSNVLDINLDLQKLAQNTINLSQDREAYIVISSPHYYSAILNIEQFIQYFVSPKSIFRLEKRAKVNNSDFTYYLRLLALSKQQLSYNLAKPKELTPSESLLNFISKNFDEEKYKLLYQPFMNGERPDIFILSENKMFGIFNAVEGNTYEDFEAAVYKIKQIKNNLYKDIDCLFTLNKKNSSFYRFLTCGLYFHNLSQKDLDGYKDKYKNKFKNENLTQYITFISNDNLSQCQFYQYINKCYSNARSCDTSIYKEIYKDLNPPFHSKKQGKEFLMDKIQSELILSLPNNKKKIKGIAGSGKTFVLAHKAVNGHKRTNDEVLIITYNITLCNYIRNRLNLIPEDFDWSFFHITNYHNFINGYLGYEVNKSEGDYAIYSDIAYFKAKRDKFKKYSTILIDEAQDFSREWLLIIIECFATDDAEITIFADEKQNIYNNKLDESKMPVTPIVGRWNKLSKCYRRNNDISNLAINFQKNFLDEKYAPDVTAYQSYLEASVIAYKYLQDLQFNLATDYIIKIIEENNYLFKDIAILGYNTKLLQEIQVLISKKYNTNCTFLTYKEISDITFKEYEKKGSCEAKRDAAERNKKVNFRLLDNAITISTLHSFKGWEVRHLFLVLDNRDISHEKVYTAITRCKNNIYILNMGNKNYDEYFKKCSFITRNDTSL